MNLNKQAKKLATILLDSSGADSGDVNVSLKKIDNLIRKDARFRSLLQSKRISLDKKTDILRKVLVDLCHTNAIEFLGLITKERSVQLIRQVIKDYDTLYKDKEGIIDVQVHVAKEMSAVEVDTLQQNLQKAMNMKTDISIEVDEKLLGGIKFRIKNTFLDASLKSKLNRLQSTLLQS